MINKSQEYYNYLEIYLDYINNIENKDKIDIVNKDKIDNIIFINNSDKFNGFYYFIQEAYEFIGKNIIIYILTSKGLVKLVSTYLHLKNYEEVKILTNYLLFCYERDYETCSLVELYKMIKSMKNIDFSKCEIYY